ncbi:MAG: dTDP-glucose 4,6-dehydratase [Parcubacteria group bacterium Licking1014_1]|nr:MAG: dTDP-glucose 4,6-dehydratase [Parcubacteria group bacterium Licking1014_1]
MLIKRPKILITGGAGFIGSNFIKYILNKYQDYQVINFDKLTYCGNLENLTDIENNPRYEFIKGDICNSKIVDKIASKELYAIINFAAESHVDRSILDPTAFLKTGIQGTYTLLEAAKKYKIEKFIQISTDEVYGSIEKGSFKETDLTSPSSPYSAVKAAADLLSLSYFKTYDLPVIITRSTNNFGPFQYPEKIIPLFITNLLENKKIPIYGDGLNTRDWLYVLDNCKAIDLVLHKGEKGQIYNIGSGNEKNNLELTKLILKKLGKDEKFIEYVNDRPGHDRRYAVNYEKIKRLGWKDQCENFEELIKETILWYKKNKNWWKKIKTGEYLDYYKKQYNL